MDGSGHERKRIRRMHLAGVHDQEEVAAREGKCHVLRAAKMAERAFGVGAQVTGEAGEENEARVVVSVEGEAVDNHIPALPA